MGGTIKNCTDVAIDAVNYAADQKTPVLVDVAKTPAMLNNSLQVYLLNTMINPFAENVLIKGIETRGITQDESKLNEYQKIIKWLYNQ